MSENLKKTIEALKKFLDNTPFLEDVTYSRDTDLFLAVYDWGPGTAYVRYEIDDADRRVCFSVDYGLYCERPYIRQMTTFLTYINARKKDIKMTLYPNGRMICESTLSYKNAPLKHYDFDDIFIESFFFELYIDDLRRLCIGELVYPQEIVNEKIKERKSLFFKDFDDDDDDDDETVNIDPLALHNLLNGNIEPIRSENSELVDLINTAKDNDSDKEDT